MDRQQAPSLRQAPGLRHPPGLWQSARAVAERLEPRWVISAAPLIADANDDHSHDDGYEVAAYLPPQQTLFSADGLLSPAVRGNPLAVAKQFLKDWAADFGLRPADLSKIAVTDQYTDADTGFTHIYLRQKLNGLQIVNANLSVHLTGDNRVIMAGGGFVAGAGAGSFAVQQPRADRPGRTAVTAIRDAARHYHLPIGGEIKQVKGRAVGDIERRQLFRAAGVSVDDVPARLHYVAAPDGLALAWDVVLRTPDERHWFNASIDAATGAVLVSSDWVSRATYKVFALPTEAPDDGPGGVGLRTLVTDPHDPVASPFGWHDTDGIAGAEHTVTRGNNVYAYLDRNGNNVPDVNGSPDGGPSLSFDHLLDLSAQPTVTSNQQAATTNLFYWNNVLHDVHARYGFTEASGNFQVKNYGGQGAGNDAVNAEAQDGSGANNADFAAPPDGSKPRMQMFLFNATIPGRDGDLDSHIVIHEYGHGVSTRLTGGPSNANSLVTDQSGGMGEGWSDWWALMLTMKPGDGQFDRYPIGTYVYGQDRVTGAGIRRYPYSYDMAVDPLTFAHYNSDAAKQVHRTGEIWCSALWDLTWLLVNKHGYSADITQGYGANVGGGNGGNNLALKLVMEGLKLQPANPSFTQARDAILAADTALTGGANHLQIWQAFARRGLGYGAATNSSSSGTVTLSYALPPHVSPAAPDLLDESDTGASATDNLTKLNNAAPGAALRFSVAGVADGVTVGIYADGVEIGSAVASGGSVVVATGGAFALADGEHTFTARQTLTGQTTSPDSAPLIVTIDTVGPQITRWQSAAVHGLGVGEAGLDIIDDGTFVEPRFGGVQTLLLTLSQSALTSNLSAGLWGTGSNNAPLDLWAITHSASYRGTDGNPVLAVTFSSRLPDFARYLVRVTGLTDIAGNAQVSDALTGDRDRVFTVLSGDITGDRRTNNTDVGAAIGQRGINPVSALSATELRADLTLDGRTNNTDVGAAIGSRGKDARELATPAGD